MSAEYPADDTVLPDKLRASVAASMALEKLARRFQVEMLVLNDLDTGLLTNVGLRPGFTPLPGTDDVMVVPEGDKPQKRGKTVFSVLWNVQHPPGVRGSQRH